MGDTMPQDIKYSGQKWWHGSIYGKTALGRAIFETRGDSYVKRTGVLVVSGTNRRSCRLT